MFELSLTGSLRAWHKAYTTKHICTSQLDYQKGDWGGIEGEECTVQAMRTSLTSRVVRTLWIWIISIQNYITYDEIAMIMELENFREFIAQNLHSAVRDSHGSVSKLLHSWVRFKIVYYWNFIALSKLIITHSIKYMRSLRKDFFILPCREIGLKIILIKKFSLSFIIFFWSTFLFNNDIFLIKKIHRKCRCFMKTLNINFN